MIEGVKILLCELTLCIALQWKGLLSAANEETHATHMKVSLGRHDDQADMLFFNVRS